MALRKTQEMVIRFFVITYLHSVEWNEQIHASTACYEHQLTVGTRNNLGVYTGFILLTLMPLVSKTEILFENKTKEKKTSYI